MTNNNTSDIKLLISDLRKQRKTLEKKEEVLDKRADELKGRLSKISKMTVDEAKKILLDEVQKDLTAEIAKKVRRTGERIKLESEEKAREMLTEAGFSDIQIKQLPHDFQNYFYIMKKNRTK